MTYHDNAQREKNESPSPSTNRVHFRDGLGKFGDIYWANLSTGVVTLFLGIPMAVYINNKKGAIYAGALGLWLLCGLIIFTIARVIDNNREEGSDKTSSGTLGTLDESSSASSSNAANPGVAASLQNQQSPDEKSQSSEKEKLPTEKTGNTVINVSSANQSGGITAGVIHNYQAPSGRELNGFQRAKLIDLLKGHGKIYTIGLRRAQGSIEAQKFGDMLESALMEAGWKFRRCRFLITERELQGIGLMVADINNPPESAIALASAMKEIGYPLPWLQFPYGEGGQKMTDDGTDAVSFDLIVGLQ